ncbi:MAG: hypothetical protein LBD41_04085 [Clostridiales Family XIII bacterium]|nr:hypothetical protein [Clostridiales Family XIII bacterium]
MGFFVFFSSSNLQFLGDENEKKVPFTYSPLLHRNTGGEMLVDFYRFCVFLVLVGFLFFFCDVSYAGRTVNIDFKIPDNTCVAANGDDKKNYSLPFELDSNNNILNLNAKPGAGCFVCGGAGKGAAFDYTNPTTLLGDVRNNTLNINCNVSQCFLSGGMTSTGTVSFNTLNIYAGETSTEEVA